MELIVPQKHKNGHFVSTEIYVTRPHRAWKFRQLLEGTLILNCLTLFSEILYEMFVDFEQ